MSYANPKKTAEYFGVTTSALRTWANKGFIEYTTTDGGHRRYKLPDETKENIKKSKKYIYARVSSKKQEEDLERQVEFLKQEYPSYEVVTDIGSGLNFKRQGFRTILEQLFEGDIGEVVISSSDRFSRFGTRDFFWWLFEHFGGKLTILKDKQHASPDEELSQDLLEIITVFTARHHGRRSYTNNKKDSDIPESDAEGVI